ncbi:MAG: DUF624 domain-containing protein [Acholeplasmataceae bacterium]|jgi:uncharacterized membrane protein YesL|nr:DUF624 domain-containing protein [Acholeplasmataceae bacterium]
MFEKIINSKIYNVIDKIVKVFWVNILTFLATVLGLVFFSFGPAILAGTYTVKLIYQKYEGPVFPVFYNAFKRFYKRGTIIFLIFVILLFVLGFNNYYFFTKLEKQFDWYSFIMLIVMFFFFSISLVSLFHSLLLATCFSQTNIFELIKNGIKLTFAFILRSLVFLILLMLLIFISYIAPILIFLLSFFTLVTIIEFILFRAYDKIEMFDNISNQVAQQLIR